MCFRTYIEKITFGVSYFNLSTRESVWQGKAERGDDGQSCSLTD